MADASMITFPILLVTLLILSAAIIFSVLSLFKQDRRARKDGAYDPFRTLEEYETGEK